MGTLLNTAKAPTAVRWATFPKDSAAPLLMGGATPGLVTLVRTSQNGSDYTISDGPGIAWPLSVGPLTGPDGVAPDWSKATQTALFVDLTGHVCVAFAAVGLLQNELWVVTTGLTVQSAGTSDNEQLSAINAKLDALVTAGTPEFPTLPSVPTADEVAIAVTNLLLNGSNVAGFTGNLGVPNELALSKTFQNYNAYSARAGTLWAFQSPEFWTIFVGVLDAMIAAADTPQARRAAAATALASLRQQLFPQPAQ